ncbi:30S ribosome-binding factor RbfA [Mycoplasmopsis cricetuli]|uniref:30S ribosome-binding factor RbfA n=1 Tax=Mycoplasmopsis cricetuli TaxID=171283 RepID=UPI0004709B0B|nr:30S ribosome-binding factor RbfA [Mycoplasmopsis cricetuli]
MNNINLSRKESQLQQILANILTYDLTNSNIIDPVVIDVKLSSDLSFAKAYVTLSKNKNKGIKSLNNASGYIRTILSKNLKWRKVPKIIFLLDNVIDHGILIDSIIGNLKKEK